MSSGYVDPNIPNPGKEEDADIIIYGYTPHLVVSALALALYALLLLLHTYPLLLRLIPSLPFPPYAPNANTTSTPATTSPTTDKDPPPRNLPFTLLTLLATLCELIGYAFRLLSSPPPVGDPYKVINFVIQYFFIVVAPVFLSAGIYTILTSLILQTGVSPLGQATGKGRRGIVWVFVISDVIATGIQVAGAASIGTAESDGKSPVVANNVLLGGLAFQVFTFLLFLILLGIFIRRAWAVLDTTATANPTSTSTGTNIANTNTTSVNEEAEKNTTRSKKVGGLKGFVIATTVASGLVYLRTIFRLAETAQGVFGYASSHEAFFGVLEFAPVVVAIALLGVWHPGYFLRRDGKKRRRCCC